MASHEFAATPAANTAKRVKLTGRAFYKSIGSPKRIVAPMVDRSEFAWRLLTRSYLNEADRKSMLAYSPMFHARLFQDGPKFRDAHFQPTKESLVSQDKSKAAPFLDGHPEIDRPLFVQFCANKPEEFLEAAKYVAPYCDAVDLNLGCPQGIAKSGGYGAFLQEDWSTIQSLIEKLRDELDVPVTAKFRIQESKEKTLEYARMIQSAGASILTVHGRQRHQKGHNTGVADWEMIRYLRDNLPPDTVLFANGNILNREDLEPCLEATGADGIMSAEGNLSDPTIFADAPPDPENREYWRDPHDPSIGGYRLDGVFRRYLDIIYRYVLQEESPTRQPLYVPSKETITSEPITETLTQNGKKRSNDQVDADDDIQEMTPKSKKKQKSKHDRKQDRKGKDLSAIHNPNLKPMQGHLFQLLRPMIGIHTEVRDALASSRTGDLPAFERVLSLVEAATKKGLDDEYRNPTQFAKSQYVMSKPTDESSQMVRDRCKRPFFVCQPHIRPLPAEAMQIGAMQLSKKEKRAQEREPNAQAAVAVGLGDVVVAKELPQKEALACG